MTLEVLFGWMASLLCTLILVPQIFKALKTHHTDDVSMLMLLLSVSGNAFLGRACFDYTKHPFVRWRQFYQLNEYHADYF